MPTYRHTHFDEYEYGALGVRLKKGETVTTDKPVEGYQYLELVEDGPQVYEPPGYHDAPAAEPVIDHEV